MKTGGAVLHSQPQGHIDVGLLADVTCRHDRKIKSRGKGDRMTDRSSTEVL